MKPASLLYGLDDKPPVLITILLGLQHVSIIAIGLVFPVILVRHIGGSEEQARFMVSMSMLAGGVGVIVQSLRRGPVGSGFLIPAVCGPSFLSASLLCVKTGGLSLVFGMTMTAGLVEASFSRILHRLRVLFPPEITGIIVAMVGISVIRVAGINLFGLQDGTYSPSAVTVGFTTLAVMIGLNVWTRGNLKLFCILIGMTVGYLLSFFAGILTVEQLSAAAGAPLVWFPLAHHPGWSFSWAMVLPFAVAVLCSSLKSIGDITTCQKINQVDWKRPDIVSIKGGILADAVGCFSAGLFGGMGQSTSSTNIGLSIATGATSRVIAISTGALLILLAFLPKPAAFFAIMPAPVIGATLVFALGFMVVAGFQIIMSRMIDSRKTFVIGLSIIFGLMVDMLPEAFIGLPDWIQPVFASSLSASALFAVLLHLILRIGIRSTARLELVCDGGGATAVLDFFQRNGGAWAARPEVIDKAAAATSEYCELLGDDMAGRKASISAHFDELNLQVVIEHPAPPPRLPQQAPPAELLATRPDLFGELAGFMVRSYADKVRSKTDGDRVITTLSFEH